MVDELITSKEQWYDLKKYKDEVAQFVCRRKADLSNLSKMESTFKILYRIIFAGAEASDVERFPQAAEMYKVYKAAIIQACLSGYSGLVEATGDDGYSVLKVPELLKVMIGQFKDMALLENISNIPLIDWILKGESVAFIKLKENKEEYRVTETFRDADTNEEVMQFKVKQGVTYKNLDVVRIDPLDFFCDAYDYFQDPLGCVKIIRSYISSKELLSSNAYPLLSKEAKENIITKAGNNGKGNAFFNWNNAIMTPDRNNTTAAKGIEVLTFYGDYVTSDFKVLKNIKAVVVNKQIADLKYNPVSTNRIIYAPYFVDENTHRGVSPIASTIPVNKLINRVTDLFIQNLDDVANPIMMYKKGSINQAQKNQMREHRELEYTDFDNKPEFYAPPQAAPNGLSLVELILQQNKNVLGINNYISGDTSGSVRTARESEALFQSANARMRVETDVFSYMFLLRLFTSFYGFNRELALAMEEPLDPIYADPNLKVSISTNASRADKEGELRRLMEMLNLPIAQMMFSNLSPTQVVLVARYLMAKAELTDADNILQLMDEKGNTNAPPPDAYEDGVAPTTEGETTIDGTPSGEPSDSNSGFISDSTDGANA